MNFDVAEQAPGKILNFCFKKKKPKDFHVASDLLSDDELNEIIKRGSKSAKDILIVFRKLTQIYNLKVPPQFELYRAETSGVDALGHCVHENIVQNSLKLKRNLN